MGNHQCFSKKSNQPQNMNKADFENNCNQNYIGQYQDACNNIQKQQSFYSDHGLRILNDKPQNKDKKTVAVIITFCSSFSYDNLFTTIQQKSVQGTKVQVYACDSHYLPQLIEAFNGNPKNQLQVRLIKSVSQVDSDCVVLNWECCHGYAGKNFTQGTDQLFSFVKKMMDRGHMAMFSDFSLKALINQWHQKYQLGPNPFVQTKQHSGNFVIRFNIGDLKQCPSAQLQTVGDMAETGMCNIQAAGGTIVYSIDSTKLNHNIYKLQVLTVVTTIIPTVPHYISKIGQFSGSAGHVLMTYPSGGMILTSMGHWIELMKIDTSAQKVFEVAEKEFGVEKATKMRQQYQYLDESAQRDYISSNARQFVKNQAPCSNMAKKARSK